MGLLELVDHKPQTATVTWRARGTAICPFFFDRVRIASYNPEKSWRARLGKSCKVEVSREEENACRERDRVDT